MYVWKLKKMVDAWGKEKIKQNFVDNRPGTVLVTITSIWQVNFLVFSSGTYLSNYDEELSLSLANELTNWS